MAVSKNKSVETTEVSTTDNQFAAPDDWQFETIRSEAATRVIFDTIGDSFVGQYEGIEHVTPPDGSEEFDLWNFRGRDGVLYAINDSYSLTQAKSDIKVGDWVRLTYMLDVPSKRGNPMKSLRIEIRRG